MPSVATSRPYPHPHSVRPAIIAHRGVPGQAQENSLGGFALALDQGASAIELDVHLSLDGELVVHHDPVLATSGSRMDGMAIADRPLAELRAATEVELPTLPEVLELVGRRATVYVELKGMHTAPAATRLIASSDCDCAVHSFDHRAVAQAMSLAPAVPRGILLVARLLDPVAVMHEVGARTLWQEWSAIDSELVGQVHAAGDQVIAWTVNDEAVALRLAAMGVDGICTDRPGAMRALLHGVE